MRKTRGETKNNDITKPIFNHKVSLGIKTPDRDRVLPDVALRTLPIKHNDLFK